MSSSTAWSTFIADNYVANITTKDLVDLGQSVQGIAAGRITFVTLPTTGITDADGNEEPLHRRDRGAVRPRSSTTIRCR